MRCDALKKNNRICNRVTSYREVARCHLHIRRWIQIRLEELGITYIYPRKKEEIAEGLHLIKTIDPNYKDAYGFNIIHEGVIGQNINLIRRGIKLGININGKTYCGYAPLNFIHPFDNKEILLLLLKAGADIFTKDPYGNPALTSIKNNLHYYKRQKREVPQIKKIYNILSIAEKWNKAECSKWQQSIISRFTNRLPNISNRGALFDVFYEYFEFSHVLCIQNV